MEIKVKHTTDYWECGDGCCSNYDEVSTFEYDGKEYEYRSYDSNYNIIKFLEEILDIKFVEELENVD